MGCNNNKKKNTEVKKNKIKKNKKINKQLSAGNTSTIVHQNFNQTLIQNCK